MLGKIAQKSKKYFDLLKIYADSIRAFYSQEDKSPETASIWSEFNKKAQENKWPLKVQQDELIEQFTQDIHRSFSTLYPGVLAIFEYTNKKGDTKSYFVVVVANSAGNGVYNNTHKRTHETNTLMSCFLINSSTDLNTLASVVSILLEKRVNNQLKSYKAMTNLNKLDDQVAEEAEVSNAGMAALFPKAEYRTFYLNKGMHSLYRADLR